MFFVCVLSSAFSPSLRLLSCLLCPLASVFLLHSSFFALASAAALDLRVFSVQLTNFRCVISGNVPRPQMEAGFLPQCPLSFRKDCLSGSERRWRTRDDGHLFLARTSLSSAGNCLWPRYANQLVSAVTRMSLCFSEHVVLGPSTRRAIGARLVTTWQPPLPSCQLLCRSS